ncbi:hypothetical protein EB796_012921 [Bugula neritina]|uniref:Uncharacterized protein n=1 Tax=Bugula neritina TaxID=10212 RepID=A0A7J7JTQ6_BUGNE|nr:hypothetical protein EB796_012921 [Bugula neritina]
MVSSMLGCLQNEEIVELLSDPNDKGNTPLMSLAEIGQHKSLAELLEQAVNLAQWDEWKAYFKQRNYENQNILHLAARSFSLDNIYDVLSKCLSNLNFEELMYPDVHGNTPIQYVAAKYNTKIFADFMLRLPLPMRQKIADFSNSKLANCRNIINQKAFSELNYIKKILADENHKSLVSKYEHTSFLMRGWEQITHPEKFYKYDETIFKVLKYCLNEYSLLDSAYTISYSLSLAAVCQQKSEQRNRVPINDLLFIVIDEPHMKDPKRETVQRELNEANKHNYKGKPKIVVIQCPVKEADLNLIAPDPDYLILTVKYHTDSYER